MDNVDRKIRPIKIFGYVLIGLSVISPLFFYWVSLQEKLAPVHIYFVIFVAIWDLVTGLGVIKLTRWGYYLFKFFLYLLLISFPIGTIISYKTFSYMKKNNIKNYFFKKITLQ